VAKSPDAFRTISEVADWLDTPAHVLRFWESKFPQIKPVKRAGGRRYYRPEDMALLGGIKTLLHEDGLTIKGAQKLLREKGVRHVSALGPSPMEDDADGMLLEGQPPGSVFGPGEDRAREDRAASGEDGPQEAAPAAAPAADHSLPAFLRRSPGMAGASAPTAAAPGEADAATPEDAEDPLAPEAAGAGEAQAPAAPDSEDPPPADAAEATPGDPLRSATGGSLPGDTPAPDTDDPPPADVPEATAGHAAPLPQPAIPEAADLVAALAAEDPVTPTEPRVIHETHDPGSAWQPELPFGSLRPLPVTRPAPRGAGARTRSARAEPGGSEPVGLPLDSGTRPGLLSLLAHAEVLAADPARLDAALARLEALRNRPGP